MKIIKSIVCVALSVAILLSFAGCFSSEPGKEVDEPTSKPVQESKEQTFGINETAVFNTLKITATEIKESKGSTYFGPDEGNIYVGINFTIENISDEEQTVSSLLLFDGYVDDVSCDLSFTGATAFDSKTIDGTIAPGKKIIGWYVVEVSEDWKTLELDVQSNWLSSAKARFVFNK